MYDGIFNADVLSLICSPFCAKQKNMKKTVFSACMAKYLHLATDKRVSVSFAHRLAANKFRSAVRL